jgi:hypothetical protein
MPTSFNNMEIHNVRQFHDSGNATLWSDIMKKDPVNLPVTIQVFPIEGGDCWIDINSIVRVSEYLRKYPEDIGVSAERFAQLLRNEHKINRSLRLVTTCEIYLQDDVVTVQGVLEDIVDGWGASPLVRLYPLNEMTLYLNAGSVQSVEALDPKAEDALTKAVISYLGEPPKGPFKLKDLCKLVVKEGVLDDKMFQGSVQGASLVELIVEGTPERIIERLRAGRRPSR